MTLCIPCPHPGCSGVMVAAHGSETAFMLKCTTCTEYYYKVGNVICINCHFPRDTDVADAVLNAPQGQPLKHEMVEKLNQLRVNLGLQPFSQPLSELGQTDESQRTDDPPQ